MTNYFSKIANLPSILSSSYKPMDHPEQSKVEDLQPPSSPSSWTIDVSDIKTVKVGNVPLTISPTDIFEFFSFSGDIHYIEMQRESDTTKVAYVTYRESQGADTAILLSGAVILGLSVCITRVENYQPPPDAVPWTVEPLPVAEPSAVQKAEDAVSTMLAKGFVLGKDALNKAKSLDEKHNLMSNASATVASLDRKIGLSEKLSNGKAVVNDKVKEMDERFQVSEITKSALAAAELTASNIMNNRYVSSGAAWFTSALSKVSKAAEDVSAMTKEKVEKAEVEKRGIREKEREAIAYNNTDTIPAESPAIRVDSSEDTNKLV